LNRTSGYLENGSIITEISDVEFHRLATNNEAGDSLTIFTIPDDIEFTVNAYGFAAGDSYYEWIVPFEGGATVYHFEGVAVTSTSEATFTTDSEGIPSALENDLDGDGDPDEWIDPDSTLVGVTPDQPPGSIPTEYCLVSVFPNPFNNSTKIRFGLPTTSTVNLIIYNLRGQVITTLEYGRQNPGYHEIVFNGSNLSSGIYLYRIEADDWQATGKMVLLK
ncbi:MAG: T9SS type A sorting domain-containing protein, partial [bacterium]